MITAVVNFPLAEGTTLDKARELFSGTAPRYQSIEGLVRKYYLFNPETGVGGGCYLFEDRASAEATFSPEWRAFIADRYGADPDVRFFETPVVVDNNIGDIAIAAE